MNILIRLTMRKWILISAIFLNSCISSKGLRQKEIHAPKFNKEHYKKPY